MTPKIFVARVAPIQLNMRPLGLCDNAKEFARSARLHEEDMIAKGDRKASPAPLFNACRSIEYALKGFLNARHVQNDDLKYDFGHDLMALFDEANDCGLEKLVTLNANEIAAIERITPHYKNPDLFYASIGYLTSCMTSGYPRLVHITELREIAEKLSTPLYEYTLKAA